MGWVPATVVSGLVVGMIAAMVEPTHPATRLFWMFGLAVGAVSLAIWAAYDQPRAVRSKARLAGLFLATSALGAVLLVHLHFGYRSAWLLGLTAAMLVGWTYWRARWWSENRSAPHPTLTEVMALEAACLARPKSERWGLALGGGGLRAAVLALGFLRKLGRHWGRLDYLSVVSGGGFVGSRVIREAREGRLSLTTESESAWDPVVASFFKHREYLPTLPVALRLTGSLLTGLASLVGFSLLALSAVIAGLLAHQQALADSTLRQLDATFFEAIGGPLWEGWLGVSPLAAQLDAGRWFVLGTPLALGLGLVALLAWLWNVFRSDPDPLMDEIFLMGQRWGLFLGLVGTFFEGRPWLVPLLISLMAGSTVAWWVAQDPRWRARRGMVGLVCAAALTLLLAPWLKWTFWWAPVRAALALIRMTTEGHPWRLLLFGPGAVGLALLAGFGLRHNKYGLQQYWESRLATCFVAPPDGLAAQMTLASLRPKPAGAWPLLIFNATMHAQGARQKLWRLLGAARFEMSPVAMGSAACGWRGAADSQISLMDALGTSSAFVSSQLALAQPRLVGVLLNLLNLRFGAWLRNPKQSGRWSGPSARFLPLVVAEELFGTNGEDDAELLLSDGGFTDNLGIGALVTRGCQQMIALDTGADPRYEFKSLLQVVERLVVQGALSAHDLESTRAQIAAWSPRAGPILTFTWGEQSLILVKPLPLEHPYAKAHPEFPQESTLDQWFDQAQFDAYLELGTTLGKILRARLS